MQSLYANHAAHPDGCTHRRCWTWHTDLHTRRRPPRTEPESASRVHTQPGLHEHRDKGRTSQDKYSRRLLPTHASSTVGSPHIRPPAGHTCHDSTPLGPHSAKAPKPYTQSVCAACLLQCTQAMYTRTQPPWSDCTHQPPPPTAAMPSLPALREGANSPGRMVRD